MVRQLLPDDGHPDTSYLVYDLTGDTRDEIIVWDPEQIWIYTQSNTSKGGRIYAPKRPPIYSESNYLPVVSWPVRRNNGQSPGRWIPRHPVETPPSSCSPARFSFG